MTEEQNSETILENIRQELEGQSFSFNFSENESIQILVKNGRVFKIDNLTQTSVRLLGVRWTDLLNAFYKDKGIDKIAIEPFKTASKAKKESKASKGTTNKNKSTREAIQYSLTANQKKLLKEIFSKLDNLCNSEEKENLSATFNKVFSQYKKDESKAEVVILSLEECLELGNLYDRLDKKEFKGVTSLIARTQWVKELNFEQENKDSE